MPRSRSIFIQSERVDARFRLAFTSPASWMAPPNSSSFSVSVVLPASGWEMMAKVRRRATSAASGVSGADSAAASGLFMARMWQGKRAGSRGPIAHQGRAMGDQPTAAKKKGRLAAVSLKLTIAPSRGHLAQSGPSPDDQAARLNASCAA